jgi:hypothetical protein
VASPMGHIVLVDRTGKPVQLDELIEQLRREGQRVLADDDVGLIVYVGDLDIYELRPTESGEYFAHHVTHTASTAD